MDLFVARHGKTVMDGCCRGSGSDPDLDEIGEGQTLENLRVMAEHDVRILYTSNMHRAWCAGALARKEGYGMDHVVEPDFNPIHAGLWEGQPWKAIQDIWAHDVELCETDARRVEIPRGNETVAAFERRTLAAFARLMVECRGRHEAVGIVLHGCGLGVILAHVTQADTLKLRDKLYPTGSMVRLRVEDATMEVVGTYIPSREKARVR